MISNSVMGGSGKWIGVKRYNSLPEDEKGNWNPAWKEYSEEVKQEMQYCEECGHELGIEDVVVRTPIGEPYRYYEAGPLQKYFSKRLLEQANSNTVMQNGSLGGKKINFTRYSPLNKKEEND